MQGTQEFTDAQLSTLRDAAAILGISWDQLPVTLTALPQVRTSSQSVGAITQSAGPTNPTHQTSRQALPNDVTRGELGVTQPPVYGLNFPPSINNPAVNGVSDRPNLYGISEPNAVGAPGHSFSDVLLVNEARVSGISNEADHVRWPESDQLLGTMGVPESPVLDSFEIPYSESVETAANNPPKRFHPMTPSHSRSYEQLQGDPPPMQVGWYTTESTDFQHFPSTNSQEYPSLEGPSMDTFQQAEMEHHENQGNLWSNFHPDLTFEEEASHDGLADSLNCTSLEFLCNAPFDPPSLNELTSQHRNGADMHWFDEVFNSSALDKPPLTSKTNATASSNLPMQRFQPILPNPPRQPGPQRSTKTKAKRKPYLNPIERHETALTRRLRGCMRCRMNRKRCHPDPANPVGPCLSCQKTIFNIFNLPCLRYKITDSMLYRVGAKSDFEERHPLTGPRYGDFHLPKTWTGPTIKVLDVTQDRGVECHLEVRQFQSPADEHGTDTKGLAGKGRSMFAIPWALTDAEKGLKSINTFIDASIEKYVAAVIDQSEPLIWEVFQTALSLASPPQPNIMIRDTLRLWTAARFIEGGWRCCGDETLGAEQLANPLRPAWWVSLPPYIDYQFASIIMQRVLAPLRRKVLKALEDLILANKAEHWFYIFLATFMLLYNYELSMRHEARYASKRKLAVRYSDMNLIRSSHSGAKTLLAHFHYMCKGNLPFQQDFDWESPSHQRMAQLSTEQLDFIRRYVEEINKRDIDLKNVSETDHYEDKYWFTSQLFEHGWKPKDTAEYSPPRTD